MGFCEGFPEPDRRKRLALEQREKALRTHLRRRTQVLRRIDFKSISGLNYFSDAGSSSGACMVTRISSTR